MVQKLTAQVKKINPDLCMATKLGMCFRIFLANQKSETYLEFKNCVVLKLTAQVKKINPDLCMATKLGMCFGNFLA